jgi:hypothetical protein
MNENQMHIWFGSLGVFNTVVGVGAIAQPPHWKGLFSLGAGIFFWIIHGYYLGRVLR